LLLGARYLSRFGYLTRLPQRHQIRRGLRLCLLTRFHVSAAYHIRGVADPTGRLRETEFLHQRGG
jgi:hypothetical protein